MGVIRKICLTLLFLSYRLSQPWLGAGIAFSSKGAKIKEEGGRWYVDSWHSSHAEHGLWSFSSAKEACRFVSVLA